MGGGFGEPCLEVCGRGDLGPPLDGAAEDPALVPLPHARREEPGLEQLCRARGPDDAARDDRGRVGPLAREERVPLEEPLGLPYDLEDALALERLPAADRLRVEREAGVRRVREVGREAEEGVPDVALGVLEEEEDAAEPRSPVGRRDAGDPFQRGGRRGEVALAADAADARRQDEAVEGSPPFQHLLEAAVHGGRGAGVDDDAVLDLGGDLEVPLDAVERDFDRPAGADHSAPPFRPGSRGGGGAQGPRPRPSPCRRGSGPGRPPREGRSGSRRCCEY